jgi:hypothetical protein
MYMQVRGLFCEYGVIANRNRGTSYPFHGSRIQNSRHRSRLPDGTFTIDHSVSTNTLCASGDG